MKFIQYFFLVMLFASCVRSVEPPAPKVASVPAPVAPSSTNHAPETPSSLSCATSPLGLSLNNACTLIAANPADLDGDAVSYANDASSCSAVSVSVLTGNVTFTAPAKGASCLVKVKSYDGSLYSSARISATITGTNNSPNTPASLTCATSPAGGSGGNVCTLTIASPADIDSDAITYSDDASTCTATVINAATGNATFTAPAKGATCLVKVKAYDGIAYSSAKSSATITGANNPPNTPASLSCPTSPVAASVGNVCTVTAAATLDPDGDAVTYVNDGSTCPAVIVNSTTGGVTFTAPATGVSCSIRLKAYDATDYSVTVVSTINGTNNAPATPAALSCNTSPNGGSLNNTCTLTAANPADPEGDTVSYFNHESTCSSVVVNSTTGNVTFTAPLKGATCLVKVRAFDGSTYSSAKASDTITGGNNSPNTPASLSCNTTPSPGSLNNACTLTAAATRDPDGDAVTYVDDTSTCGVVVVNAANGSVSFTAPASGATCEIRVKAFDSSSYSTALASTITGTNHAPHAPASLTCATTPFGGSANNDCTLSAANPADPDGDSVSYSDDGSTCGAVSVSALVGDATFTAPAKGQTCLIKIKAYDGVTYGNAVVSGVITGINNAPNAPASISCATTPPGGSTGNSCTITASNPVDSDSGDSVTYANSGSTCNITNINATTGEVTFTAPSKNQNCLVKIKANDGAADSQVVTSAQITGQNNSPNAPSLSCPASLVAGSSNNICTLTAASPIDPDGDSVTYVDGGSDCSVFSVNSSTGAVTFTAPTAGNSCSLKVKAYDGGLYSSIVSSTVTPSSGSSTITLTYSNTATPYLNANIFNDAKNPSLASPVWDGVSVPTINVTINSGVIIGSSSVSTYSMITNIHPTQVFPAGTQINIINNGKIIGAGGAPGLPNGNGGNGGNALLLTYPVSLNNSNGTIAGGGGGGAGGPNGCFTIGGSGGASAGVTTSGAASATSGAPGMTVGAAVGGVAGSTSEAISTVGQWGGYTCVQDSTYNPACYWYDDYEETEGYDDCWGSGAGGGGLGYRGGAGAWLTLGGAPGWAIIGTDAITNNWSGSGIFLGNNSNTAVGSTQRASPAEVASIVSGGSQADGNKDRTLDAVVVKFTIAGVPVVSGLPVAWTVTAGDGVLSNCESTTDASGESSCTLTTKHAITNTLTASTGISASVTSRSFSACNGSATLTPGTACTGSYSGYKYAGDILGYEYITTAADSSTSSQWSTSQNATGASSTSNGLINLQTLQTYYGVNFAAKAPATNLCQAIGAGWYLPARDELPVLTRNAAAIGLSTGHNYWTSTEQNSSSVAVLTGSGYLWYTSKLNNYRVRCVRRH